MSILNKLEVVRRDCIAQRYSIIPIAASDLLILVDELIRLRNKENPNRGIFWDQHHHNDPD